MIRESERDKSSEERNKGDIFPPYMSRSNHSASNYHIAGRDIFIITCFGLLYKQLQLRNQYIADVGLDSVQCLDHPDDGRRRVNLCHARIGN